MSYYVPLNKVDRNVPLGKVFVMFLKVKFFYYTVYLFHFSKNNCFVQYSSSVPLYNFN